MPRKTVELFKKVPYARADAKNPEGFPAFTLTNEQLLRRILHTGTIENTFYVNANEQLDELLVLLEKIQDTEYIAEQILSGRTEGFMRLAPLIGMAYLMDYPEQAKTIFNKVVITGNDLADIINIRRGLNKGLGRAKKTMLKMWLKDKLTEYYALKYREQIIDAINLTRVSEDEIREWFIDNKELQNKVIKIVDFLKRKKPSWREKLPKQLCTYEKYKQALEAKEEPTILQALIKEGRLPFDVCKGLGRLTPETIKYFAMFGMGVFALLKNLVMLERRQLLEDEELVTFIRGRLKVEALQKSKVFPFRIYQAYTELQPSPVKDHLAELFDKYVEKYDFTVFGKTAIAIDVSGSMTSIHRRKTSSPIMIAAGLGGMLYKGLWNSIVLPFDTKVHNYPLNKRDSIVTHTNYLIKAAGGGTNMDLPIKKLMELKRKVDTVIYLTDSIEWAGTGFLTYWIEYRKKINPKAVCFQIRIDPYRTNPYHKLDGLKHEIFTINGWSDNVFKFMTTHLEEKASR